MAWYEVQLTPAEVVDGAEVRAMDQFMVLFDQARAPRDMAMFSGQDAGEDTLHLYFLLPAGDLSEAFVRLLGAGPCEQPAPHGVAFSAGHNETGERFRAGQPL